MDKSLEEIHEDSVDNFQEEPMENTRRKLGKNS